MPKLSKARNRGDDRRAAGRARRPGRRRLRGPGRPAAGSSSCARPGATRTTTRRRAPDGGQLLTRDQALVAKGQWEAQMATGAVAIGRERFETLLAALPAPRQGRDDPRLLGGRARPRRQAAAAVLRRHADGPDRRRRSCATGARRCSRPSRRASGRPRRSTTPAIALLGCCRMAVADGLMAHNPVLDVRPLPIEFSERPYLRLAQINPYVDACARHYRPLAQLLIGTGARVSGGDRAAHRGRRPRAPGR